MLLFPFHGVPLEGAQTAFRASPVSATWRRISIDFGTFVGGFNLPNFFTNETVPTREVTTLSYEMGQ